MKRLRGFCAVVVVLLAWTGGCAGDGGAPAEEPPTDGPQRPRLGGLMGHGDVESNSQALIGNGPWPFNTIPEANDCDPFIDLVPTSSSDPNNVFNLRNRDAIKKLNRVRRFVGVPCVQSQQRALWNSVQHHADYVARNFTNQVGCLPIGLHFETGSCPLFWAVGPSGRGSLSGYTRAVHQEITAGRERLSTPGSDTYNDPGYFFSEMLASIYHSYPLLHSTMIEAAFAGSGICSTIACFVAPAGSTSVDTGNFDMSFNVGESAQLSWPWNGATGVGRRGTADIEFPRPLACPGGYPCGYPIKFILNNFAPNSHLVENLTSGGTHPSVLLQQSNDSSLASNEYAVHPNLLAANTTYRVSICGPTPLGTAQICHRMTFTSGAN